MRRLITAVLAAAFIISIAGPAQANDVLTTGKNGFPPASAISASLGTYTESPEITVKKFSDRWYVCADLQAKAQTYLATAVYSTTPPSPSGMRADARVYSSPKAAKVAFNKIKAGLKKCVGSQVVETEPGSSMKWVTTTSVGTVPTVIGDGDGSLFVYQREKPATGSSAKQDQLGSSYSVLTLVGDSILVSDAAIDGATRFSKAQRAAVASFANDFAKTWSAING